MHIVVPVIAIHFPNTSSAQDKIWSLELLERYAAWEGRRVRLPLRLELPLDQRSCPWFLWEEAHERNLPAFRGGTASFWGDPP